MGLLGELVVQIVGDTAQFVKSVEQSGRKLTSFERDVKRITRSLETTGRALTRTVTLPLAAAAAGFVILADKQAQAEAALQNAIDATGKQAAISVEDLKVFTAELQNATTFGDEAQLSALALVQQLANLDQNGLKAILPGLLDFSTAMGVDLQTAASLVGKTLGSSTNALSRYGLVIDATASPTEKLAQLTQQLEEKFGGAAETAARAGLGPLRQLKNSAGDLAEQFGALLIPSLIELADKLRGFVQRISELDDSTKQAILRFGGMAAAAGPLLLVLSKVPRAITAVRAALVLLTSPAGAVFAGVIAIVALTKAIVDLIQRKREFQREVYASADAIRAETRAQQEQRREALNAILEEQLKLVSDINKQITDLQQGYGAITGGNISRPLRNLNEKLAEQEVRLQDVRNQIALVDSILGEETESIEANTDAIDTNVTSAEDFLAGLEDISGAADDAAESLDALTTHVTTVSEGMQIIRENLGFGFLDALHKWQNGTENIATATEEQLIPAIITMAEENRRAAMAMIAGYGEAYRYIKSEQDDTETVVLESVTTIAEEHRRAAMAMIAGYGEAYDYIAQRDEEEKTRLQQFVQWYKDHYIDKIFDATQQLVHSLADLSSSLTDRRLADLAAQDVGEQTLANRTLSAQIKLAKFKKAVGAFDVIINTARAVMEYLAQGHLGLSIAAGAAGAIQLAAILAQPLPSPSGAIPGSTTAPGGVGGTPKPHGVVPTQIVSEQMRDPVGAAPRGAIPTEGSLNVVVNLDGQPILNYVGRASRDRRVLIDAKAVV